MHCHGNIFPTTDAIRIWWKMVFVQIDICHKDDYEINWPKNGPHKRWSAQKKISLHPISNCSVWWIVEKLAKGLFVFIQEFAFVQNRGSFLWRQRHSTAEKYVLWVTDTCHWAWVCSIARIWMQIHSCHNHEMTVLRLSSEICTFWNRSRGMGHPKYTRETNLCMWLTFQACDIGIHGLILARHIGALMNGDLALPDFPWWRSFCIIGSLTELVSWKNMRLSVVFFLALASA